MKKIIKILALGLSLTTSLRVTASSDGFVYQISDQTSFSVYEEGLNKGLYKIITQVPKTTCSAEFSAFVIQPAYNSDLLSFSGRVENLICDDPVEEKLFSGKGGVTGRFNETKNAVSEMVISLWFFR